MCNYKLPSPDPAVQNTKPKSPISDRDQLLAVIGTVMSGGSSYLSGMLADAILSAGYHKRNYSADWMIFTDKTQSENDQRQRMTCTRCGNTEKRYGIPNYCPMCGADMKGVIR